LKIKELLVLIKLADWQKPCFVKSNLADLELLFLLKRYLYQVATKSNSKCLLQVMEYLIFIELANLKRVCLIIFR